MPRRDATCPLCGARLSAGQVLAHCDEVADLANGILGCHCPFCQGYFEVRAGNGGIEIGYLRHDRFDRVLLLPVAAGMQCRLDGDGISIRLGEAAWRFEA